MKLPNNSSQPCASSPNERTGFLVAVVFLGLNGFRFHSYNQSVVLMICRLAAAELPWADLQAWFKANSSVAS